MDKSNKLDASFKILTLGESGVGKTCLLLRFTENKFMANHLATIGIDYKSKNIQVKEKTIKLKIWDTAGQERFRNITQQYYKGADGIVLVYDVSDRNSFEMLRGWITQISTHTTKVGIVLVGNKCDKENRKVLKEEAEDLGKEHGLKYIETSALENIGVEETFDTLGEEILRLRGDSLEKVSSSSTVRVNREDKTKGNKKCC